MFFISIYAPLNSPPSILVEKYTISNALGFDSQGNAPKNFARLCHLFSSGAVGLMIVRLVAEHDKIFKNINDLYNLMFKKIKVILVIVVTLKKNL